MLGILVVDKPLGLSSHDVVNRLRRILGTKRVGHSGTLDPLASGVLVLAVGPATRFLQYLDLEPKEYVFEARFGVETTSQDAEGEVVRESPVPEDLQDRILAALPQLTGEIQQIPPMFSAVKLGGKPLYELARKGVEVEREPRTVFIHQFELESLEASVGRFRCVCSGGTYVRTLAHDLGQIIGCGAYVTLLRRTKVGSFGIENSVALDACDPTRLLPLKDCLGHLPQVELDAVQTADVWNGQPVAVRPVPEGKHIVLIGSTREVIGMAQVTYTGFLQPVCVIPQGAPSGPI